MSIAARLSQGKFAESGSQQFAIIRVGGSGARQPQSLDPNVEREIAEIGKNHDARADQVRSE
jgi:hypothetical protein